jgi:hypothetical protein
VITAGFPCSGILKIQSFRRVLAAIRTSPGNITELLVLTWRGPSQGQQLHAYNTVVLQLLMGTGGTLSGSLHSRDNRGVETNMPLRGKVVADKITFEARPPGQTEYLSFQGTAEAIPLQVLITSSVLRALKCLMNGGSEECRCRRLPHLRCINDRSGIRSLELSWRMKNHRKHGCLPSCRWPDPIPSLNVILQSASRPNGAN